MAVVFGGVPPLYRQVYDLLFESTSQCQIDHDVFVQLMSRCSGLSTEVLSSIWRLSDCKNGVLTRNCLYKSLALIAMAQQGKPVNDKSLENYAGQDLPAPNLGTIPELVGLITKLPRVKNSNRLSITYRELCAMDTVKINLIPEKKGLFLKHVEYEVSSLRYKSKIQRRYNDFIALFDLLITKYPNRMIPRLPPKKIVGADARFIEQRRKALVRFLTLIVRHPVVCENKMVRFFFTYNGPDMQHKIREQFLNTPDEFLMSEVSAKKDLVPLDGRVHLATSREQLRFIHNSLIHLEEIVSRIVLRSRDYASDLMEMKKELNALACEPHITSAWATGNCETWNQLKLGFRNLHQEFGIVSDKAANQTSRQEDEILQKLNLILDMLSSYKDLWERQEKGAIQDHQKVMNKVINIRRRVQQVSVRGADADTQDDLTSSITEQDSQLQLMERNKQFTLHCLQMETQLVHTSLEMLATIFQSMAAVFASSHAELSRVWENVRPVVEGMIPPPPALKSTPNGTPDASRPTSPTSELSFGVPSI